MKKILNAFFLLFFMSGAAFAQGQYNSSNGTKYTVIKTNHDYTPVREDASADSKRFSHLKKGTTIFADKSIQDFYRIDLGLNKYYWIEKRYIDETPEKAVKILPEINEICFKEKDNYYMVVIKMPFITPYNEIETTANSVDFILYDVKFDENEVLIQGKINPNFKVSKDEYGNLKISYYSEFPLTGHETVTKDDELIFKVKKPFVVGRKPLNNIVVTVDPGHGGSENGAIGFDLKEKDINLQISKRLKKELEANGAKVYMTRDDDSDIGLYERVDYAKEKNSDFLLSIHQNSLADVTKIDKKHGVGVYYYNKEAYEVAKEIQEELVEKTNFRDDGINFASFALTRAQNPICVLIECGYIIRKEEAKKLSDKKFQKLLAKSITKGLKNYLKNNF